MIRRRYTFRRRITSRNWCVILTCTVYHSSLLISFDISQEDGNIRFSTYDQKPVNPCNDNGTFYSLEERKGCNLTNIEATSLIDVGLIYNDVWAYKLCNPNIPVGATEPERGFDGACKETGWVLWHPGAQQGGE